jgi:hypothetical protein
VIINAENDSYVITEDHYINYLAAGMSPTFLRAGSQTQKTNFLFMGYSLRDWNLRDPATHLGRTAANYASRRQPAAKPGSSFGASAM